MILKRVLIFLLPLFWISCGQGEEGLEKAQEAGMTRSAGIMEMASGGGTVESGLDFAVNTGEPSDALEERKRIKSGYMEVVVKDPGAAAQGISQGLEMQGGWVSSESKDEDQISLTLHIPADVFDAFLEALEGEGKVAKRRINVMDVTNQYTDLDEKIKDRKVLRDRYRDYLTDAAAIEEILQVERALNDLTREIDRLEGSIQSLDNRIAFSTLSLVLKPPAGDTVVRNFPDFGSLFARLGGALVQTAYFLVMGILFVLILGIPGVLMLGLLWWAAFGRLGLVKRLFAFFNNRR